jgi:hypothetical protein
MNEGANGQKLVDVHRADDKGTFPRHGCCCLQGKEAESPAPEVSRNLQILKSFLSLHTPLSMPQNEYVEESIKVRSNPGGQGVA